jgi:hypothetical protein
MNFSKGANFARFYILLLKNYLNFKSYQNMLTILGVFFLYHKLQFSFICHVQYYPIHMCYKNFENLKHTLNFEIFKIP